MDSIVQTTVQDNIELGCAIVEKAAMEKSVAEINEQLAHAFIARKRQRERGLPWVEVPQYTNSRFPSLLPDALRLRPGYQHQVFSFVYKNCIVSLFP